MKTKLIYSTIYIFLILNSGCQKSPECWGGDKDKGLIEKSFPIMDIPICIETYVEQNEQVIIRDSIDISNLLDSTCNKMYTEGIIDSIEHASYKNEVNQFFMNINFDTQSLLGFWATGKCEADFIREVLKDDKNLKYTYSLMIKECGWCDRVRIETNVVQIPKIDINYGVEFKKLK